MSRYINTYARVSRTGDSIPSKKRLIELLKDTPDAVVFTPTSWFDDCGDIRGDAIPLDVTLSVVGPDPAKNRKWYAAVSFTNSKLKVV